MVQSLTRPKQLLVNVSDACDRSSSCSSGLLILITTSPLNQGILMACHGSWGLSVNPNTSRSKLSLVNNGTTYVIHVVTGEKVS